MINFSITRSFPDVISRENTKNKNVCLEELWEVFAELGVLAGNVCVEQRWDESTRENSQLSSHIGSNSAGNRAIVPWFIINSLQQTGQTEATVPPEVEVSLQPPQENLWWEVAVKVNIRNGILVNVNSIAPRGLKRHLFLHEQIWGYVYNDGVQSFIVIMRYKIWITNRRNIKCIFSMG